METLLSLFGVKPAPGTTVDLWWDVPSLVGMGVVVLILGLVAFLLPLRALRDIPPRRALVLTSLRALVFLVLGILLLHPAVVLLTPLAGRERLAVLVDSSRSMSVAARPGGASRFLEAVSALGEKGFLAALAERYQLEIYSFTDRLQLHPDVSALATVTPTGEESDIGAALQQLSREGRDLNLGGVVVLSDGIDRGPLRRAWRDGGEDPDTAIRQALRPLDLPIHTVSVSSDSGFIDVAIDDLSYNEFAFLRQPTTVRVSLRSSGLAGRATPVQLTQGNRVLSVQNVTLPADGQLAQVDFELNPERVGKYTYTVSTPVLPEEAVGGNNRRSFTLKVVRDRIRVLQIVGAPSWDEKFMRRLLKADPNVDLVSFFILRSMLDQRVFSESEYSLIEFPYRDLFGKDLPTFDVVMFQNFNYLQYFDADAFQLLTNLAHFVEEGGGLVVVGGDLAFGGGDYGGSPLEEVLPVRSDRSPSVLETSFPFSLTPQGTRHPVTNLHFDVAENRRMWEHLPRLDGFNPVSLQPGAVLLGEVGDTKMPLLAVRQVGKGRSLALMADTSWYWSFKGTGSGQSNSAYLHFWKNSLRWLVGDPDEGQVQVDTEQENYQVGTRPVISVRVVGVDYTPMVGAAVKVEITPEEGGPAEVLEGVSSEAGDWTQGIEPRTVGPYRVKATVVASDGQEVGSAETVFTINQEGPEMKELEGDLGFLQALSRATGGKYLPMGTQLEGPLEVKPRADSASTQRTVIPLWNKAPGFIVLLTLLCAEWLLRRRWGLK